MSAGPAGTLGGDEGAQEDDDMADVTYAFLRNSHEVLHLSFCKSYDYYRRHVFLFSFLSLCFFFLLLLFSFFYLDLFLPLFFFSFFFSFPQLNGS